MAKTGSDFLLVCLAVLVQTFVSFRMFSCTAEAIYRASLPSIAEKPEQEKHFLKDFSSICSHSTYSGPKIYHVGESSAKCVSQDPIRWNVSFYPIFWNPQLTSVPHRVKLEWHSCGSIHPSQWNMPGVKIYYKSVVEFNVSNISPRINRITIECTSTKNGTQPSATWNWIKSKGVGFQNLAEGTESESTTNDIQQLHLCDSLSLASDITRSKLTCLKNKHPPFRTLEVRLHECLDWLNCQQLVARKFKANNTCGGTWSPSFCDVHPESCTSRDELLQTDSGIISCKNPDGPVFYMPFFKIQSNSNRAKVSHMISDLKKDSEDFIILIRMLKIRGKARELLPQTYLWFKCSAPKFVALAGFQWTAIYSNRSNVHTSKDCSITRNDTYETYAEILICKITAEYLPQIQLDATCTVFLQTGQVLTKNVSQKYPRDSAETFETFTEADPVEETVSIPKTYLIVGIVCCLLVILLASVICFCKIRQQKRQIHFSAEEIQKFMEGTAAQHAQPPNKAASVSVLPYDINLEVPRKQIIMEPKLLGQGAFGKVMKGRIGERPVAIKTTNKNVDGQYFRALLSELKIMAFVGKHTNVVELVGANTERIRKQDVYLIFEYCENGNILEYIRSRRDLFEQQSNDGLTFGNNGSVEYENGVRTRLCSGDLKRWSVEIAAGMEFISSKKVYHGDLAARNILLTRNLVAKVGDFGLARELKDYSLYVQQAGCPLPLKWMSIESLRDLEFSIQSDVWSFGITLWEIFSLGTTPYPGVEWNFQAWKRLQDGERMERPSHATEPIYSILMKCWETQPQDRPSFAELKHMLKQELE